MRKIITAAVAVFLLLHGAAISAQDLTVTTTRAGASGGSINLTINGGFAPYTFAWTGPNGFQASTEDLNGIVAGEYCVDVTDGLCGKATLCAEVLSCSTINFSIESVPACSPQSGGSLTVVGAPTNVAYIWSNGSTNSVLTDLSRGDYSVTVTDPNGCQSTQSANVGSVAFGLDHNIKNDLKLTTDSIQTTLLYFNQEKSNNNDLKQPIESIVIGMLTPNPFRDAFNLDITSVDNTKIAIQVTNSIGQLVYEKQEELLMGKNQVIVELAGRPDGFYFVQITDAQNRKEVRKIVKSKN